MNLANEERAQAIIEVRKQLDITRKEFSDALGLTREEEKKLKLWEERKEEIPERIYNKIITFPTIPPFANGDIGNAAFTMIDLFAGIGGIRLAFQNLGGYTVFSSEWDKFAQKTYRINYGEIPNGDITKINEMEIPEHDILLAGFPCQPFSQAGLKLGFEDTRGTLFFDIARIIRAKRPRAFLLENVKQLRGHKEGRTLQTILEVLRSMNYYVPEPEVLCACDFGVPQNRERIIIVGFDRARMNNQNQAFQYPVGEGKPTRVGAVLQDDVDDRFIISDKLYQGHIERRIKHKDKGNGFGFSMFNADSPYTNTISARYYKDGSEALIDRGEGQNPRMLTPRECARLQGFPDEFIIPVSNAQAYKQFGNTVSIPVIQAVAEEMLLYMNIQDMM